MSDRLDDTISHEFFSEFLRCLLPASLVHGYMTELSSVRHLLGRFLRRSRLTLAVFCCPGSGERSVGSSGCLKREELWGCFEFRGLSTDSGMILPPKIPFLKNFPAKSPATIASPKLPCQNSPKFPSQKFPLGKITPNK